MNLLLMPQLLSDVHMRSMSDERDVVSLMLATMTPELQNQYEEIDAHNTIEGLKGMFRVVQD
jgi:hypothetical protein